MSQDTSITAPTGTVTPVTPATASAVADVDPVFQKQLKSLQAQASAEASARLIGSQTQWMMPEKYDWKGSLTDIEGIASPFSRQYSNDKFVDAIKDPKKPGTVGDLIVTTTQIDYLATMERAFRVRHGSGRVRAILQANARKTGQGKDGGSIIQCPLEHVRAIVKQSKDGGR